MQLDEIKAKQIASILIVRKWSVPDTLLHDKIRANPALTPPPLYWSIEQRQSNTYGIHRIESLFQPEPLPTRYNVSSRTGQVETHFAGTIGTFF